MNKLYAKLALTNICKNKVLYLPFILSGIMMTAFTYMMGFITHNEGLDTVPGSSSVKMVMSLGIIIITIFSFIFLFYTNSFLIKRRQKEFGVYNMLGMEKRHIMRVIGIETMFTAVISVGLGILAGILFSKLLLMVLFKLISVETSFGFMISAYDIKNTLITFAVIFAIILLFNLIVVAKAKTIELIKGGNVGEKEPKTKLFLSLLGFACLFAGYYVSITTQNPVKAILYFFGAVILVIIGTYLLFTTGSIFILKLLKKNKNYYYKKNHMTSVAGMLYRMKQNAAGLANICILSTMVLVTVSTTVSLYVGLEDVVNNRYPYDITVTATSTDYAGANEEALDVMKKAITSCGLEIEEENTCGTITLYGLRQGNRLITDGEITYIETEDVDSLIIIANRDEYVTLHADMLTDKIPELEDNQAFILGSDLFEEDTVNLLGMDFKVAGSQLFKDTSNDYILQFAKHNYIVLLPNEETVKTAFENSQVSSNMVRTYNFNLSGSREDKVPVAEVVSKELASESVSFSSQEVFTYTEGKENNRAEFAMVYGGLLFLGIACGLMFLFVTVMIIFYKQISEGYDDRERFQVMEKVGMSQAEVKHTINAQVRMVFFLPLVIAVCHMAGAFPMVVKILAMLMLSNVKLFIMCLAATTVIFAIIYFLVFKITSRSYYAIVK